MQTAVVKCGNSQEIWLTKLLLDSLHLSDNDTVDVMIEGNSLIIKKIEEKNPYKTIQERFSDFDGEYEPIEINWGKPVGKEIW
jgi:antitoxin MazE